MKWYKDMFLGNIDAKEAKKVIKQIKLNKYVPDLYIISFAANSFDLLDIVPAWQLCQKDYPKDQLQIIGLAYGKEESTELVRQIIDESYQVTGHTDVRRYLKGKWRDEQWK